MPANEVQFLQYYYFFFLKSKHMQKPTKKHIWIIKPDFTSILPNNCMFTMQLPSGGCTSFEIYLSNETSASVTYSQKM